MKLGVTQIVSALPAKEFILRASEIGYDCVELSFKDQPGCITVDSTDEFLQDIKDYAKECNIEIISTCIGGGKFNLLADGEVQKNGIEEAVKGLEVSEKLGAKTMLHTLGSFNKDLYYEDAYNNSVKSLKAIAKGTKKLNCMLAIEMVWNGFLFSPLEMRRLIETVGKKIGFYFDPGNMAVFQFPQHWVRALGSHTKMVHFKDWKGNALNGDWPALLDGDVDFKQVLAELKSTGYDPVFIHEVGENTDSFENSFEKMKQIAEFW